jgi:hypothetical protein
MAHTNKNIINSDNKRRRPEVTAVGNKRRRPEVTAVSQQTKLQCLWSHFKDVSAASELAELLSWRGPNGERVDATDCDNCPILFAFGIGVDPKIANMLMAWRGANGERVDPTTRDGRTLWDLCWYGDVGDLARVQLLLDWRGEDGKMVGSTAEALYAAANHGRAAIVAMLLSWQPTKAEVVDVAAVTAALSGACNLAVVNQLLGWRGAGGEQATVSDELIELVLRTRPIGRNPEDPKVIESLFFRRFEMGLRLGSVPDVVPDVDVDV